MDFYRIEHHTIMNGLVIRYRVLDDYNPPEVTASREGVGITGSPCMTSGNDLSDFTTVLKRAYQQHLALKNAQENQRTTADASLPFKDDPACVIQLRKAHFAQADEILEDRPRPRPHYVMVSQETKDRLIAAGSLTENDFLLTNGSSHNVDDEVE